ncbi:MAG: hypothetical protein ACI30J_00235, partial [Paludibacteraceae bacterium]
ALNGGAVSRPHQENSGAVSNNSPSPQAGRGAGGGVPQGGAVSRPHQDNGGAIGSLSRVREPHPQKEQVPPASPMFPSYEALLQDIEAFKLRLSALRKKHLDRLTTGSAALPQQTALLYLNILQETQQLLSELRHFLRAYHHFAE